LREERLSREGRWTESVAVGSKEFATTIKKELRERGIGKKLVEDAQGCRLKEARPSYLSIMGLKSGEEDKKMVKNKG
jgi:hypothetical protein